MKILKRLLLVLLLLLVVGVGLVWVFFDPLVRSAIEKGGTYATGVETKLASVSASPVAGKFGLEGLSIANPPGFRPEPFVSLGSAHASWQNGTLLSDTIEMDELVVENVNVNLERAGGGTNYGKILDNLGKLSGGGEGKKEPEPAAKGGKSLRIKKIEVKSVHAELHLLGTTLPVTVPSIVIKDFKSDGDTKELVAKLTRVLIRSILDAVLAAGKGIFPDDILKDLGNGLKGIGDVIGSGAKDAAQGVQDVLKGAGDLFKKK